MTFVIDCNTTCPVKTMRLVMDMLEMTYANGIPVLLAAWLCARYRYSCAREAVVVIADGFTDWRSVRTAQVRNGVKVLNEAGFFAYVNACRMQKSWKNMPKHLFFACINEVKTGKHDPTPALRRFLGAE